MKKILYIALVAVLASCVGTPQNSDTKTLCGGWSEYSSLDSASLAVFNAAVVNTDSVGYVPATVARQVVAGMNYKYECETVNYLDRAKNAKVEITIYAPLRGKPQVTKIEPINKNYGNENQ